MSEAGTLVGGRYRLLSIAGQGGMAQVWRAELESIEGFRRPVAIKRILHHVSSNAEHRAMFVREARLTALLDHPNVVQVYDFGEDAEGLYLVLEWVEGLSLRDLIDLFVRQRTPPSPALVAAIGIEILRGLEAAHENVLELPDGRHEPAPIIHRDISPSNVLLSVRGITKLADFGLARAMNANIKGMTPAGIVKGKLSYMAPEVLRGRPVSPQTDLYSTGVALWEFLCGRRLYSTENDVIQALIRAQRAPVVRMHRPDTPTSLADAIDKALAPDPDERWSTAGQFARALADALRQIPERTDRSRLAREMKAALTQFRLVATGQGAVAVPRAIPISSEPSPPPPPVARPPAETLPAAPIMAPVNSKIFLDPSAARKLLSGEPGSVDVELGTEASAPSSSSHSVDVTGLSDEDASASMELSAASIEVLDLEEPPLRKSLVPAGPALEPEAASMAMPLLRKLKPEG